MAKLEAYDKSLDYSYAPGIFPATECLNNAKKRCMRLLIATAGAQSEGVQALTRAAQACALLSGRDYITPDDVRRMTLPVLSHRLVLNPEARMKGVMAGQVLSSLLEQVAVPVSRRK